MKRQASIERSTKETKIRASVDLDGTGVFEICSMQIAIAVSPSNGRMRPSSSLVVPVMQR